MSPNGIYILDCARCYVAIASERPLLILKYPPNGRYILLPIVIQRHCFCHLLRSDFCYIQLIPRPYTKPSLIYIYRYHVSTETLYLIYHCPLRSYWALFYFDIYSSSADFVHFYTAPERKLPQCLISLSLLCYI